MALNFPNTPTDGQQYTHEDRTWEWSAALGVWSLVPVSDNDAQVASNAAAQANLHRNAAEASANDAAGSAASALTSKNQAAASATTAQKTLPVQSATPPAAPLPQVDWINSTTGKRYTNVGSTANPVWVEVMAAVVVDNPGLMLQLKAQLADATDPAKGAGAVGYNPGIAGGYGTSVQNAIREGRRSLFRHMEQSVINGVQGVGPALDVTAAIKSALEYGGNLWIPDGDYFIAGTGPDSGGVVAIVTQDLDVLVSQHARFYTDSLDNDMIRIMPPSDGSGLPAGGIRVRWQGGLFDQREQCGSTTMPFITEYPPRKPGASATCDGLSIRGDCLINGVPDHGIDFCEVSKVVTFGGEHWQIAGGDSGILVTGCRTQRVAWCYHIGNRDLGCYTSGGADGALPGSTQIFGNTYKSCFHGSAVKRSGSNSEIYGNHYDNCPRAILHEWIVGPGAANVSIHDNTMSRCGVLLRMQYVTGGSVHDNHAYNSGAMLEDGTTLEGHAGLEAWGLYGCKGVTVANNTAMGVSPLADSVYPTTRYSVRANSFNVSGTLVQTSYSRFVNCLSDGYRAAGESSGDNNIFDDVRALNAANPNIVDTGTNNRQTRTIGGVRSEWQQSQFSDGTSAAPSIARRGQPSVGLRFATSAMHMTVNTTDRVSANNVGVGFNGSAPIAKPSVTGSKDGNVALQSLITRLVEYGLITDSTT